MLGPREAGLVVYGHCGGQGVGWVQFVVVVLQEETRKEIRSRDLPILSSLLLSDSKWNLGYEGWGKESTKYLRLASWSLFSLFILVVLGTESTVSGGLWPYGSLWVGSVCSYFKDAQAQNQLTHAEREASVEPWRFCTNDSVSGVPSTMHFYCQQQTCIRLLG